MSFTSDLLTGIAQYLAGAGIGVTYKPAGGYVASETAVFFKELPTTPDRCIAITAYSATDQPREALSNVRVQFWFRGVVNNSLDVDDLGDSVFNVMQGLEHQQFAGIHMIQALRISSAPLGLDGNKRCQRTDNYALDVNPPGTALRPE